MILYRAINIDDINNLKNGNNIYSSIINSYLLSQEKEIRKNVYSYYNLCIKGSRQYALDTITGHVSGQRIGAKISPWISVTSDFEMASSEYSVPQSGKYNYYKLRKPVILLNIPDDKILSEEKEVFNLRNRNDVDDFAVDLRSNNLSKLFENEAIMAEKYNMDMPGYDVVAELNRLLLDYKTKVSGFSNFSTATNELLIFSQIKKEYIKAIMSPELVDVLYSCNINIEEYYDFITNNYRELNIYLKILKDEFIGKNLTDYLVLNYDNIDGNNIEEKYQTLKEIKLKVLSSIVNSINKKYNTNFKVSRLLDDNVLVKRYENISDLSLTSRYDLVLIEKDNKIYEHNFKKSGFYNKENDESITSGEILKIINGKTKVRK